MFTFEDIETLFSFDLDGRCCIEIEFSVKGYPEYQSCWMGKMPNEEDEEKDLYWYGLVTDGSESYEYDNFQDFSSAPVFDGKSLKKIWNRITILSIDGCDPDERIAAYLKKSGIPNQITG